MSWIVAYLVLSVLCLLPGPANGQGQTTDVEVIESGDDWQCPSTEEREKARKKIHQIAALAIATTFTPPTTTASTTTASATTASTTTMPSTTAPGTTTPPTMYTCNGTPGWRRVAFIDMTNTSYNCPTGLSLTSYSKRTCGQSHTTAGGCSSTTFSVGGLPYSRVCGRIRGYQFGSTDAFFTYTRGIDSNYVDGLSLTHGAAGSRQHIWTFAAGLTEVSSSYPTNDCPCDTGDYTRVPAFVGNDYFCESGFHSPWSYRFELFPDDVLWDGQNCTSTSTCCQLNNPPWFTKNLPNATTDDIELRICTSYAPDTDDVPIELIELYVQ